MSSDFFVAGGTLPLDSASYIERVADKQILESLLGGRFCYVLNSRQMGKSSLCVRTMSRLAERGIRCAFIDITKLGGRNVTPEQWYAGMALEIGRSTGLRKEILEYWKAEASVGPMQRFFGALRQVVLGSSEDRFVVFVDEIDSTRSLPFNTDEFFAGVRECFNRRVQEPEFERLTFCFLGVAVPSDLMKDARTTPFNIGDRIYLRDFALEEALPLAQHLGPEGDAVLRRVHYWTNGHPFLTQSICRALMHHAQPTVAAVDEMIRRDLLEPKVRETNINLSDVGNRVLNGYADGDDVDAFRADILSAYQKALSGRVELHDDESNRITAVLKLSGLMRSEGKRLLVRNRIYEHVFGKDWIVENMPEQEVRRQRSAYTRGVIRTALIAAGVVSIIGFLAISNFTLRKKAEQTAQEMSWRSYVADMNRLPVLFEQNNVPLMEELLARHEKEAWRGPEWDYWSGRIDDALWKTPARKTYGNLDYFPGHKRLITVEENTATIIDTGTGTAIEKFELPPLGPSGLALMWDGRTLIRSAAPGDGYLYDLKEKKVLKRFPKDFFVYTWRGHYSRDGRYAMGRTTDRTGVIDLQTMEFVYSQRSRNGSFYRGISADGRTICRAEQEGNTVSLTWLDISTKEVVREWKGIRNADGSTYLNDRWMTLTYSDGWMRRFRLADRKLLWEIRLGEESLESVSESEDGSLVAASTLSRSGYLVKVENGVPRLLRRFTDASRVAISEDGRRVYPSYRRVRAYDSDAVGSVVERQLPDFLGELNYYPRTGDVEAWKTNLVTYFKFENGDFRPWHVVSDAEEIRDWRVGDPMEAAVLLVDGKAMRLMNPMTKKTIVRFEGRRGREQLLLLDENRLLYTGNRRDYELIEMKTGKRSPAFGLEFQSSSIALSRDRSRIAVGGTDGTLSLLDANTLKVLWSVKEHLNAVSALTFSREGAMLATASGDDTAIVWDVKSGEMVSRMQGHAQTVIATDFLPGNTRVVTASLDKTLRLWDVATGSELTTIGTFGGAPGFCAVSKDDEYIIAGDQRGLLRAWPLASQPRTTNKP